MLDGRCSQGFMGRGDPQNGNSSSPAFSSTSRREGGDSAHPFRVSRRDPGPEKSPHEAGSAGTLAGELPVELFAGKGAGAPGDGSWVQGFNARNVLSGKSHPGLLPRGEGTAVVRFWF